MGLALLDDIMEEFRQLVDYRGDMVGVFRSYMERKGETLAEKWWLTDANAG